MEALLTAAVTARGEVSPPPRPVPPCSNLMGALYPHAGTRMVLHSPKKRQRVSGGGEGLDANQHLVQR